MDEQAVSRRAALAGIAVVGMGVLAGCAPEAAPILAGLNPLPTPTDPVSPIPAVTSVPTPAPAPTETAAPPPSYHRPHVPRSPAPNGSIYGLPKNTAKGKFFAWTCDDGVNAKVIEAYAAFAEKTGARFTFFLNGSRPAVQQTAERVRPMVEAGVIQIGNHTWSHPDLTKLSNAQITSELQRNHDFIHKHFGVDARPFFRPPYGFIDKRVASVAAGLGYTVPTMWYGSLSDSSLIAKSQIKQFAKQWFLPEHIVIAHLNYTPIIGVLDQLWELVQKRGLTTVTLNDVYSSKYHK